MVMAVVTVLRAKKRWTAARLAAAMTDAGVPWTRDTVVNLENGRRKRLAVHEVLALAYVLDAETPLDLLVPDSVLFPVTPKVQEGTTFVRDWFDGRTGPLHEFREATGAERTQIEHDRAVRKWREALADAGMRALIPLPKLETESRALSGGRPARNRRHPRP